MAKTRRPNTWSMSEAQLAALRNAFAGVQDLSDGNRDDERGYYHHAGLHGLPLPYYCEHGSDLFLPWHRAYLYFFEKALQEIDDDAALPWWDWLNDASHANGLPDSHASETLPDGSPNPLAGSRVWWDGAVLDMLRANVPHTLDWTGDVPITRRNPGRPASLPGKTSTTERGDWNNVDEVMAAANFYDFSNRLEDVHGGIHLWCGGTMSVVPTAAFDPIFWSHHAMIDRLWYLWQNDTGSVVPPSPLQGVALDPFPVTVDDVWLLDRMETEYVDTVVEV